MEIINNADAVIIVLHEIYGINQHMEMVCKKFSLKGYDVICPNLVGNDNPFSYDSAEEAYKHFMNNIGFEHAVEQVMELIGHASKKYKHIYLVGYSIGATIAWLCSKNNNICDGIIGYYGSRIRNYAEIEPKCPVLLVFAKQEKSFDVRPLVDSLEKKNIEFHVLNGKHGFYDPFSINYNSDSSKETEVLTNNFINKVKYGINNA